MSEDVKKIVRGIWKDFSLLDVRGEILHSLYPQEVIDRTAMEQISRATASSEAAMYFLMHLESYATIDTLRTLLAILRETSEGHNRHKELADLLERKLPKLVSIAICMSESVVQSAIVVCHWVSPCSLKYLLTVCIMIGVWINNCAWMQSRLVMY